MGIISSVFGKKRNWAKDLLEWSHIYNVRCFPGSEQKLIEAEQIKFLHWENTLPNDDEIDELPEDFCNLKNLKRLILGSGTEEEFMQCNLYKLPKCIGKLENLEELHLQKNSLTHLPKEIGNLKKLKKLKLGGNKLETLPKEIGNLKQLELLTIWSNELIELPQEIIKLTNLKGLSFWDNPIEFNNKLTPEQIKWLKNLEKNGCDIEYIDLEDLYNSETRYKIVSEECDDEFGGYGYYTLKEIESNPELIFKNNCEYRIYNGNNELDEELMEKYSHLFNTENDIFEFIDDDDRYYDDEENDNDLDILDDYGIEYVYHMTHYKNIESILENGLLSHNNDLASENIDNVEVNDRRNKLEPIHQKNIHNYVPFYFNPKNPMLFANKEIQEDIVILAFSRKLLLKDKTIYTDGNAASSNTAFYYYLEDLDKLNWQCINSRYWNDCEDGKREIMAEVLVDKKVKIKYLKKVYCYDEATKEYILNLDNDLNVKVKKNLYF